MLEVIKEVGSRAACMGMRAQARRCVAKVAFAGEGPVATLTCHQGRALSRHLWDIKFMSARCLVDIWKEIWMSGGYWCKPDI